MAADGGRRPRRRKLAADRRAGQPLRHHAVACQGRTHAWREAARGCARHRLRDERRPHHRGEDRQGRHRLRKSRQLRRPVGAAGRRYGRHQRAAAAGEAPVHHHRKDRRTRGRRADHPRSRPANLFQGRGRRAGDGRLRAEPASLDDRRRAGRLGVPAVRRRFRPFRAAYDAGDRPRARALETPASSR